jgi:protein phosphatase
MSKSSSAPNYSRADDAALDVRPITPAIGAEIHGVRLTGDLPGRAVSAIRDAIAGGTDVRPAALVCDAIAAANNRIFTEAREHAELSGMACVLTLALVEGEQVAIGHVGDSRLYLIAAGAIRKVTSDHSPVGETEDAGEIGEEAASAPRRYEVFRDVGGSPRTPIPRTS